MKLKPYGAVVALTLLSGCAISPEALTPGDIDKFTRANLERITQDQEAIHGRIGLYQAMARALKYNLDFKVEMMNEALKARQFDLKKYDMLPQLVANTGYAGRNNFSGGRSRSLITGITSLEPSTSTEKNVVTADLSLSWHVLDFGLSYVRARQAADEVLIAEERRRKVVNRIVGDVRTAYWRAVSADRLIGGLTRLRGRVYRALRNSRNISSSGQASPLTAMTYERELIDIKRQIHTLHRELRTAKMQLAALMNVPPGVKFRLAYPRRTSRSLRIKMSPAQMIAAALRNRPELHEAAYKARINVKDGEAALLELLPGATLYAAANVDSNDFLFHNSWLSYGAKASWNLMRLFQYPARKSSIKAKEALLQQQALALTMAVMTQVYVARARYSHLRLSVRAASEYANVQYRILRQVRSAAATDAASEQSLIREEMNYLVARVRYDIAYADLQNAYAGIYTSIGVDPYGANITGQESIRELAKKLRRVWSRRSDRSSS